MSTSLVTGSSGLSGAEVVEHFPRTGWAVHGVDHHMRADFFGFQGDTRRNQRPIQGAYPAGRHHETGIRGRDGVKMVRSSVKPYPLAHAATQSRHDLAAGRPFDEVDVNAGGTPNPPEKVYEDSQNWIAVAEGETRWGCTDATYCHGIGEVFPLDRRKRIHGYSRKQVWDNLHSFDDTRFIEMVHRNSRWGTASSIGGCTANGVSIREDFGGIERLTGREMVGGYVSKSRAGDRVCYTRDLRKMKSPYLKWGIPKTPDDISVEVHGAAAGEICVLTQGAGF